MSRAEAVSRLMVRYEFLRNTKHELMKQGQNMMDEANWSPKFFELWDEHIAIKAALQNLVNRLSDFGTHIPKEDYVWNRRPRPMIPDHVLNRQGHIKGKAVQYSWQEQ